MKRSTINILLGIFFLLLFAVYVFVTTFPTKEPEVSVTVQPLEAKADTPEEVPEVEPVIEEPVVEQCSPPFIKDGDDCCLDNDYDYVCDPEVSPTEISVNCDWCDDGNPCTYEVCIGAECIVHCQEGNPCDDGDIYTSHDTCVSVATGDCSCRGDPVGCVINSECDDGNPCSEDSCINNVCNHVCRVGITCDDQNPKTAGDTCVRRRGICGCEGKRI